MRFLKFHLNSKFNHTLPPSQAFFYGVYKVGNGDLTVVLLSLSYSTVRHLLA
jgi:hypothetical protein